MSAPGRWKDPENEYRVLYFADNHVGAYVETLQNLRPDKALRERLAAIVDGGGYGDPPPDVGSAVFDTLKNRRSTIYFRGCADDRVVDVLGAETKSDLEADPRVTAILEARHAKTGHTRRLKNGDMSGGDYVVTNAISRAIYEAEHEPGVAFCGIRCPSSEHEDTVNFSLFEDGRDSGKCRATLVPHLTHFALDEKPTLNAALKCLGVVSV